MLEKAQNPQIDSIARLFREARKAKALQLREMASIVGISYSHISRLERGERQVQLEHLDPFCAALDIPRWLPRAMLLLDGLNEEERGAMLAAVTTPGEIEALAATN